jgi:hypothetical protein
MALDNSRHWKTWNSPPAEWPNQFFGFLSVNAAISLDTVLSKDLEFPKNSATEKSWSCVNVWWDHIGGGGERTWLCFNASIMGTNNRKIKKVFGEFCVKCEQIVSDYILWGFTHPNQSAFKYSAITSYTLCYPFCEQCGYIQQDGFLPNLRSMPTEFNIFSCH